MWAQTGWHGYETAPMNVSDFADALVGREWLVDVERVTVMGPDDDDASAFAGGARSPAFGGAPPPKTRSPARARSPRSPAPRLSERQAAALRAALSRCVQSTANAVADEIADDPEVCEAFGARPLGLAVGFLRTLAENPVDHRAVGEIVARSAAAAGGRSPRTA